MFSKMKKFQGKKLLLLGSNVGSVDIVKYTRENGGYVYVADYLPKEKSPAKEIADEAVLISTGDTELLEEFIRRNDINGVFAGISEFNLLQAQLLSSKLGLPFYCSRNQWDSIENKAEFRHLCELFHVPHPKTYFIGSNKEKIDYSEIKYPIVVKPVDGSSSLGVSFCYDFQSAGKAIDVAIQNSQSGDIIIEEFFRGDEFTAHYTIVNGRAVLACIDNRYPVTLSDTGVTSIPSARIYPSKFYGAYLQQVNISVVALCESLNLKAGVLFVQGIYNKSTNKFSIFEAGLRCAGEAPYRFLSEINGVNFMNNLVDYALLGKVPSYDLNKEDPLLKGNLCCTLSYVSKGGIVGKIIGLDETVAKLSAVKDYECRYKPGDLTPSGNTLRQIMLRFVLICKSENELAQNIDYINSHVIVLDEKGNDLCIKFDSKRIFTEFKY